MLRRPFFILSCARSGSTSLARILDSAENGHCACEPAPNLNVECRDMMDGRIDDPRAVVDKTVVPRVRHHLSRHEVYGEKNVTYGPFIPELHAALGCRFIYLKRDGRDVVRSMMDWHNRMFGTIYRECIDPGDLSPRALQAASRLLVHKDTSDYSRPRPRPGEELYERWETLSREEMCAYYFSRMTHLYLDALERLPATEWTALDYTEPSAEAVVEAARFVGLRGLHASEVTGLLNGRINSLQDRIGETDRYPHWTAWDSGLRDRFTRIAQSAMIRAGFWSDPRRFWKPPGYGRFWLEHDGGPEWYQWMYNSRKAVHDHLVAWVQHPDRSAEIESIADFGCGVGVGYRDHFADRRYVGIDLVPKNIDWCRTHLANNRHEYRCLDYVAEDVDEKFDLVFSSGTIDNSYDVDEYLKAMVRASRKWVYVTCYRGWFPDLQEHRYWYAPAEACFYNDISPGRAQRTLQAAGCRDIQCFPVATHNQEIPQETVLIARVTA